MDLGLRLTAAGAAAAMLFGAALTAAPSVTGDLAAATTGAPTPGPAGPDPLRGESGDPGPDPSVAPAPEPGARPGPEELWRQYAAADPAQAVMSVEGYCPTAPTLRALSPAERYAITYRRMHEFTPTKAEFLRSVREFRDIRAVVEQTFPRGFAYDPGDDSLPILVDPPVQVRRIVLHYTAGPRPDLDGVAHARLMSQMGLGTGYNYYINDDDERSRVWWTSSEFVHHVKHHNGDSLGIEVAACTQAGIRPRQWEQLIYLVAHLMQRNNVIDVHRPITDIVTSYVLGHREIGGAPGHADFPKVVTEPFRWRLIDFLVDELGYQR